MSMPTRQLTKDTNEEGVLEEVESEAEVEVIPETKANAYPHCHPTNAHGV